MAEKEKNNKKGKTSASTVSKESQKGKTTGAKKNSNVKKVNSSNTKKSTVKSKEVKNEKIAEEKVEDIVIEESKDKRKKDKEKKANLKQARKQLYYDNSSDGDEFTKLIKIVLIVTAIIVVFYGVTVVVTKKADEVKKEENREEAKIQYDSIMIGSMLNINGSFYVLIENQDDVRLGEYNTMLQTIKANDDAPTIYTADLSSGFNREFLSDKSDYASDMEKFRVTGTTLVKIEDHEIDDVYDNYDDIIEKLDELD